MNYVYEEDNKRVIVLDNDTIIGECDYIEIDNVWNITHTVVKSNYQGQGIAKKMVLMVIEKAQEQNKNVIADCSYARKIITAKEK